MTHSLPELLADRAASQPDALAFTHDGASLTYRQLHDEAGALAAGLVHAGVAQGDRVALLLPAGLDWVRAFWAIQRAGAVSCAFNPHVPHETAMKR
ncbi:MAG TPA: class I adenylate-forming enzyme family protein, partial [Thermoanaerobaculia bacterium]